MNRDLSKYMGVDPQRIPNVLDAKFRSRWRNYVAQVAGGTAYLAIALLLVDSFGNLAVVSAIAASVFLAFCAPHTIMAQPRRMLGGHVTALLVTLAISPLGNTLIDDSVTRDIGAALAVGITMLIMVVTNTEHAPAAGTALGLSLEPWQGEAALSVLLVVLLLIGVHYLGRGRLVDLF